MTIETLTMTNVKQAVPFFNVTDMNASLRFYVDGIGFRLSGIYPCHERVARR